METKVLTKADFNDKGKFIGHSSILSFNGNLEIEEDLNYVYFDFLNVKGYIIANIGTGIKAKRGIEAGGFIQAERGIKAGWGIKSGESIESYGSIKAGWGIEAGELIIAEGNIKSGCGIIAGLAIRCRLKISAERPIFAGLNSWKNPRSEDLVIECGKVVKGDVVFGILRQTGLPD